MNKFIINIRKDAPKERVNDFVITTVAKITAPDGFCGFTDVVESIEVNEKIVTIERKDYDGKD